MLPRERYMLDGPEVFGDAELVALTLGTGVAGRPARMIAQELLDRAGGLALVSDMPVRALAGVSGVGPARAVGLHAAFQAARRAMTSGDLGAPVCTAAMAFQHFGPRMAGLHQEELHGLFLNRRNMVRAYRVLTRGNDGHTIVDPRQVYRQALLVGASSVIVAHNHPSGDPSPSSADVEVTVRLVEAGRVLGMTLLDHLVVAGASFRSLAEEGLLKRGPTLCSTVVA